jgi:hypothetical protein
MSSRGPASLFRAHLQLALGQDLQADGMLIGGVEGSLQVLVLSTAGTQSEAARQ